MKASYIWGALAAALVGILIHGAWAEQGRSKALALAEAKADSLVEMQSVLAVAVDRATRLEDTLAVRDSAVATLTVQVESERREAERRLVEAERAHGALADSIRERGDTTVTRMVDRLEESHAEAMRQKDAVITGLEVRVSALLLARRTADELIAQKDSVIAVQVERARLLEDANAALERALKPSLARRTIRAAPGFALGIVAGYVYAEVRR